MRIGYYTCPQRPSPGWRPTTRTPRLAIEPTLTSVVAHVRPGNLGDEPLVLDFDEAMDASPAITLLSTTTEANAATVTLNTGDMAAQPFALGAGVNERYLSAGWVYLRRNAGATGYVSVQAWTTANIAGGSPAGGYRGPIATINLADLTVAAWTRVWFWGQRAYPVTATALSQYGYLVISAAGLTAGTVDWGGIAAVGPNYWTYTIVGGWVVGPAVLLSHAAWQGAMYPVLRGLAYRVDGPTQYEIDVDDGFVYQGYIQEVEGRNLVFPRDYAGAGVTDPPSTAGVATDVRLSLALTGALI